MQAATKSYVDANPNAAGVINVRLPPFGARLDGVRDDTAAFKAAYQAATAGAVDLCPERHHCLKRREHGASRLRSGSNGSSTERQLSDGTPLAAGIPTGGAPVSFVLPGLSLEILPLD